MTIRKIRISLLFYRGFCFATIAITVFCCASILFASINQLRDHQPFYGVLMFVTPFFWIKTFTSVIILLYVIKFKADEMYFYYNLGIGRVTLFLFTFALDYVLFFTGIFITGLILDHFFR